MLYPMASPLQAGLRNTGVGTLVKDFMGQMTAG